MTPISLSPEPFFPLEAAEPIVAEPFSDRMEAVDDHTITQKPKDITVAAFCGGGVRGIIPARLIQEIEERTRHHTVDLFDVFAGVSSGAIVAAALNCPSAVGSLTPMHTAEKIVQLFKDDAATIFPASSPYNPVEWVKQLFWPKYSADGLHKVLEKYCGNLHLSEGIKEIVIPVAEMPQRQPWWFTKSGIFTNGPLQEAVTAKSHEILLVDVLEATTAAPSYFPYKAIKIGDQTYNFMDGGTFANNPSVIGKCYARSIYGSKRHYLFSSFGTGVPPAHQEINGDSNSGLLYWARHFPTAALNLTSRESALEMQVFFSGNEDKLYQCQPVIDEKDYILDSCDPAVLDALLLSAEQFIEKNEEMIRTLSQKLVNNLENEGRTDLRECY
jgi:hypothetical protein